MRRSLLSLFAVVLLAVAPNAAMYCVALCAPAAADSMECHHDSTGAQEPRVEAALSCVDTIGEASTFLREDPSSRGSAPAAHAVERRSDAEHRIAAHPTVPSADASPGRRAPALTLPLRI
jgi:hypothetical protein